MKIMNSTTFNEVHGEIVQPNTGWSLFDNITSWISNTNLMEILWFATHSGKSTQNNDLCGWFGHFQVSIKLLKHFLRQCRIYSKHWTKLIDHQNWLTDVEALRVSQHWWWKLRSMRSHRREKATKSWNLKIQFGNSIFSQFWWVFMEWKSD